MKALPALLSGICLAAAAAVSNAADPQPELDGNCAMSAARGAKLPTSCGVEWISPRTNKLYCFSSESAKSKFMQDAPANERSAQAFWTDPAVWEKLQKERGARHRTATR